MYVKPTLKVEVVWFQYREQKLRAWGLRYSNLRYPDGFPTTVHLQTHPHSHPVNKHIIVLYMPESYMTQKLLYMINVTNTSIHYNDKVIQKPIPL